MQRPEKGLLHLHALLNAFANLRPVAVLLRQLCCRRQAAALLCSRGMHHLGLITASAQLPIAITQPLHLGCTRNTCWLLMHVLRVLQPATNGCAHQFGSPWNACRKHAG